MKRMALVAFAFAVSFFALSATQEAFGQGTLRCESTGGDYKYCPANTQNRVEMTNQLSFSDCTKDYSWGYDRRGIWVDRGCRAEFAFGSAVGGNDSYWTADQAHNYGFSMGKNDALQRLSNDPNRHISNVPRNAQTNYRDGYRAGYSTGSNSNNYPGYGSGTTDPQRTAYQRGYQTGVTDAKSYRSEDYTRHRNDYSRDTRESYRNGYEYGYASIRNNNNNRPGYGTAVPNWLIGTWETDQGTQRLQLTFTPSGQITILTIPRRGNTTTSHGYYSNGTMVIPNFATYDIRRSSNSQMTAVNTRNGNDSTQYRRIR